MRYIKAINLSASEAEDLVAKIWTAVERHGLRSPKMTVLSTATKLEIEFLFDSRRDENLVTAELPCAMVGKILPRAMVRKIEGLGAMVALEPELYATTLGYLAG